jgi:rhomboid family GlyGly-CTERM serine protease
MAAEQPVGRFKVTLTSLNSDGRWGIALLLACALLLLPEVAGDAARSALRYDRTGLEAGEWWRLLTAHFVHLSLEHAVLNVLGFALMWALFVRDYSPGQWLAILLASIAAIDAGLWFGDSEVAWYVGASGVLHGVMSAGAWSRLRQRQFDGWILTTFLMGKLAYEQFLGVMPFSATVGTVVVDAHLYGAIGGLVAAFALGGRSVSL